MDSDWVYRAEYSLSDRSSCKKCGNGIGKDVVRLAIMQQSRFHDGKDCTWHHPHCFFQKKPNVQVDEIWHFHSLRWKDQERIRKHAEGKSKGKRFSDEESAEDEDDDDDDDDEELAAKSKRGKKQVSCGKKKKAKKDEKSRVVENAETVALKEQNERIWTARDELVQLPAKAQKTLLEANQQHIPVANKIMDRVVDMLLFGPTAQCDQCTHNGHLVISADGYHCIGSVDEWAKCDVKTQQPRRTATSIPEELLEKYPFLYDDKSEYKSRKPGSRLFPSCFKLSQSSANGHARPNDEASGKGGLDQVDGPSTSGTASNGHSKAQQTKMDKAPKTPSQIMLDKKKPLANLRISAVGSLSIKRAELTKKITDLGGLYVPKVSQDTFVLLSDEKSIAQRPVTLEMAEVCKVHVVPVDFITHLEEHKADFKTQQDLIDLVENRKMNPWTACSVEERITTKEEEAATSSGGLTSSEQHKAQERQRSAKWNFEASEAKMKVLVKNGGVVDKDADLDEETHSVLREEGILYSAVLAKSNVADGTNSFYKMQIIKRDNREVYYLFRAWGRIGTVIGGNKCDEMDKEEAIESFEFHFMDKTGNAWADQDKFVKKHGKYYQLQLDYGPQETEEEAAYAVQPGSKTTLPQEVQQVIKMIFDVEEMRKTMKEFEIDSRKMPLGKLSKKQILDGMTVLGELQVILDNGQRSNAPTIIGATNRFFTLIPHDFGTRTPPILNQSALIKDKLDMLQSLMDMQVAFNILQGENRSSDTDPIDQKYEKLACDLQVLDKASKEYQQIATYIANTHAATHGTYTLQLLDVLKVVRAGEAERFAEFKALPNHKLLWHGSRVTNYAGILSQGLRIAPPEAPVTGYMFGKGVYFADMVSKSANYCATSPSNPTGLMLLSDVALGNMYELTEAKSITRLPKGFHSVKGCGRTEPKAEETIITKDGVEIPLGHPTESDVANTSLLYNEYIVYEEAQVHMRYLLRVKFVYK